VQITSRWSGAPARETSRERVNREVYLFASLEVEDYAMRRRPSGTLPAMRRHKPTNTARITIGGKVHS
jgi:hypothetical protein